jgi:GTPase SAR1 family protein
MKKEWKVLFNLNQPLYFGDLDNSNMLRIYYFEDSNLKANRNKICNFINDEIDYSPILIGGDAGVGKSTFINNLVSKYLQKKSYFCIILNVENQPNNPIIKEYFIKQLDKYLHLLTNGKIIGSSIISKFKTEYQQYIANEMFYKDIEERINDVIDIIARILKHLKTKNQIHPKLVIFMDQVERFGSDTLVDYLSEYLGLFSGSKPIKFILCARKETIKIAKQSIKGFYSTYFKRFIDIESPVIEKILQKRFCAEQNSNITIETINTFFTSSFCDLIEDISNNNIRIMLRIFEMIIDTSKPYQGRKGYIPYFSLLIEKNYIEDMYKTINPADTIPLIKIVFDAMHYYGIVDNKFYRVIIAKIMTADNIKNIVGLTNDNIKMAVHHLLEKDFIIDSLEIRNMYELTKKGKAYSNFITTAGYTRIFAKNKNDDKFTRNIFSDQDFTKAELPKKSTKNKFVEEPLKITENETKNSGRKYFGLK